MQTFDRFIKKAQNPFLFRLLLLSKLPSAYFCGVRLHSIAALSCRVTVKYKWLSTNPFKSIYFACLAMASEMSTGLLIWGYAYKRTKPISMLVVDMKATFIKKAIGKIFFTCHDGDIIKAAIENALQTNNGQTIETTSIGKNEKGEEVAKFNYTWSVKVKSN